MVRLFKGELTWSFPQHKNTIYLTFDDGPSADSTTTLLDLLDRYSAQATFFCLGSQVEQHPGLFRDIQTKGHTIGNHGYDHLNGYNCSNDVYYKNFSKGKDITGSAFFRPPYGKIKRAQIKRIKLESKIVMWDVMPGDFDSIDPETCLKRALKHTKDGSIVVLHDSDKAKANMLYTVEGILTHFTAKGYAFKGLPI